MKILHINCNYLGSTLHQEMIKKMDSLGIENKVFVPVFSGTKRIIEPNKNVLVANCFKKWDRLVFDWKQKKIKAAIENNINVSHFDILHAYTLFTDGNLAYKLSRKYKLPYVVAIRNTDVNDFFKKLFFLRRRGIKIMRNAQKIFFLSEGYRQQVLDLYVPKSILSEIKDKTEVIPNGIDDFWFANQYGQHELHKHNTVKLVCACGINKNKNVNAIQKSMLLLKERGVDCHLTVVGHVVDIKEYERLSKDENTTFLPNLVKEELINIYRNSDIYIMPSFYETFGLVYAEAMTQGLPIIYTKGQGFDNQFENGLVGYSVKADDIEGIANAIISILCNYTSFNKQVEYSQKFRWGKIVNRYMKIYGDLLN